MSGLQTWKHKIPNGIYYLVFLFSLTTSCSPEKPSRAKTLWSYPISFNLETSECPKDCFQTSDNKVFFTSDGKFLVFDLATGVQLLEFGSSVTSFDIKDDLILVEEIQITETVISIINIKSLKVKWEYRFQPGESFRPRSAFFADSLILIQEFSSLRLRAFNILDGELIWEQPEKDHYYLGSVTVKDNIIHGEGGIHTTTTQFKYRRDLLTGTFIGDIELCGLGCFESNSTVFYKQEPFEYSYEISGYDSSFLGVTRFNTSTDEWFGCYIEDEPVYEPGIDDYPLQYRIEKILGNDRKLLMQANRSDEAIVKYGLKKVIYMMPPCNEESNDSIYSDRTFLFGIKQLIPWTKFVPINDNFFAVQLLGSTSPVFLTLSNTDEVSESELAGISILSKGEISLEAINGITNVVNVLELKGQYLISATKQNFQVNDINSKQILLSAEIISGSIIQYFTLRDYVVVRTSSGVSIISNPTSLNLN